MTERLPRLEFIEQRAAGGGKESEVEEEGEDIADIVSFEQHQQKRGRPPLTRRHRLRPGPQPLTYQTCSEDTRTSRSLPLASASTSTYSTTTDRPSYSSQDSEVFNSINRLFSDSYQRDSRFPQTPPRHHSPDAIPHPRVPPLHQQHPYKPYVRSRVMSPYSDRYHAKKDRLAHLVNPRMEGFVSDLTLALEGVASDERTRNQGGGGDGGRDLSGLWRAVKTGVPVSSGAASSEEEKGRDGRDGRDLGNELGSQSESNGQNG
ncbi:uncharacterized protein JCM6883_004632 [Sporobolomyces salmoneus]|uniref:uncharacterized protein n=1 Tax=Sporobolomyces salmoneus TaxID=183962 RepID=UPI00317C2882